MWRSTSFGQLVCSNALMSSSTFLKLGRPSHYASTINHNTTQTDLTNSNKSHNPISIQKKFRERILNWFSLKFKREFQFKKRVFASGIKKNRMKKSDRVCQICFEEYELDEKSQGLPVTFPCAAQHTLCRGCFRKSAQRNDLCPLCGVSSLVTMTETFRPTANLARIEAIKTWRQKRNMCILRMFALVMCLLFVVGVLVYLQETKRDFQKQLELQLELKEQESFKKWVTALSAGIVSGVGSASGLTWYFMRKAASVIIPLHPCAALLPTPVLHWVCRIVY